MLLQLLLWSVGDARRRSARAQVLLARCELQGDSCAGELRGEDTMAEAGVPLEGGKVEACVAEDGGMLGDLDALHEQLSDFVPVLELAAQLLFTSSSQ